MTQSGCSLLSQRIAVKVAGALGGPHGFAQHVVSFTPTPWAELSFGSNPKRIILVQSHGLSRPSVCWAYSFDAHSQIGLSDHPTGPPPKAAQAGKFIHWALNRSRVILGERYVIEDG